MPGISFPGSGGEIRQAPQVAWLPWEIRVREDFRRSDHTTPRGERRPPRRAGQFGHDQVLRPCVIDEPQIGFEVSGAVQGAQPYLRVMGSTQEWNAAERARRNCDGPAQPGAAATPESSVS